MHKNLTISIQSWALGHHEQIFFIQEVGQVNGIHVPFTLGIQTPTKCQAMLTFGKNDLKYHLFTLMGFHGHHSGIPLAWVNTSQQIVDDLVEWLKVLKAKILAIMPDWKPSCFIIDDTPQK